MTFVFPIVVVEAFKRVSVCVGHDLLLCWKTTEMHYVAVFDVIATLPAIGAADEQETHKNEP